MNDLINIAADKIQGLGASILTNAPMIIGVIATAVLFYLLAKLGQKLIGRVVRRSNMPHSLQLLLTNLTKITIMVIGLVVILSLLGLNQAVTTTLAGAGVAGIVLGFALQDIAANFISGIVLIFRKPFREGDIVEVTDMLGVVEEINLRVTILRSLSGQMIYIPNRQVFENNLTNYSETGERRVDIACGVSYDDDLKKARELAKKSINSLDFVDTQKHDVEVYYNEFGDSAINFSLRFWVDFSKQPDFLAAQSMAIEAIKETFDENNIDIPFPIRVLNMTKQETLSN